ncbi:YbaB/EbfC family nucleoid-associated protein [Saccharothrix syringae]|uniref:YbaB/EbfC family DNA-binding protein n=1 Tax=Saccharothrix syringae TaxID=103733 RepID=A0A5Q0HA85_SACSY|nr:YbaB/EbfC family nucleoid-associated protein [Saccharothrix syringae]QFZ23156.1 YbaB/EbfC family DNA-binding protein [Saccharothrix syringae]
MNPERMIADLEARAQDLARRSQDMQQQIREADATVRSADGAVTVTVAPNGALQHIEFSPRAGEFSHVQLGQAVMAAVRRAQALAARQVAAVVEPQFGGTEAMDFLTSFIPQEEEAPPPAAAEEGSVLRESWGAPGGSQPPVRPTRPAGPAHRRAEPDDEDGFGTVLR